MRQRGKQNQNNNEEQEQQLEEETRRGGREGSKRKRIEEEEGKEGEETCAEITGHGAHAVRERGRGVSSGGQELRESGL